MEINSNELSMESNSGVSSNEVVIKVESTKYMNNMEVDAVKEEEIYDRPNMEGEQHPVNGQYEINSYMAASDEGMMMPTQNMNDEAIDADWSIGERVVLKVEKITDSSCVDGYSENVVGEMDETPSTSSGIKLFTCEECNYKSSHHSHFKRHLKTHSKDKKIYSCDFCEYQADHHTRFAKHVKTHTDEKPHACGVCDFKAWLKSELRAHMTTHSGSECKKRWKSMRDHYKREKKEEKGTTGKAAKKKRAQYWQRLQFLDTVEDERTSFTNVLTPSNAGASSETPQQGIGNEYEEDALIEQTSQHLSPHTSSQHTQRANTTPSPHEERSVLEFQRPNPKQRKESFVLQNYLLERKEDRKHLKRCLEDLLTHPGPPQNENEIDMFFKAMAATVKTFRPDLATRTKASVFKTVTDMELLNQQSFIHGDIWE